MCLLHRRLCFRWLQQNVRELQDLRSGFSSVRGTCFQRRQTSNWTPRVGCFTEQSRLPPAKSAVLQNTD